MIWQRTLIFVGWSIVTLSLFWSWRRHSLEATVPRRLSELYLWLVTVPLLVVGLGYLRFGIGAFAVLGTLHLIGTAAALGTLGRSLRSRSSPAFASGALLIAGSTLVWLGAVTWPGGTLAAISARPAGHTTTAVLFLLGALCTLAGFVGLRAMLREGDEWLSRLGLAGFQFGAALWAIHLVFRVTVVLPVAEAMGTAPPWFAPLRTWAGGLYAIYMVLAYLAIAAFGGALAKTQWIGKGWGRAFVGFGLVAAVTFASPAGGPFRPPLMVQVPLYAMGVLLLRKLIVDTRVRGVAS
jgi:hypothetical protein